MIEIIFISYEYRSKDGTSKYLLFKTKEDCLILGIPNFEIEKSDEYDFSESQYRVRNLMAQYQK